MSPRQGTLINEPLMLYESHMNDGTSDAIIIANAFRQASDEDTIQAMNTQSSKNVRDLKDLYYYVVPSTWFRKAWPILNARVNVSDDWRETLGRIECAELLEWDNAVSEEEDNLEKLSKESTKGAMLSEIKQKVKPAGVEKVVQRVEQDSLPSLRRNIEHEKDFFLLGSNAWLLLRLKFGNDYEIRRHCEFLPHQEYAVAVVLHEARGSSHPAEHITIPPTGRFRYETLLDAPKGGLKPVCDPLAHPGNVSDDETAGSADDLFPNVDDNGQLRGEETSDSAKSGPVYLLPPSTTTTAEDSLTKGYPSHTQNAHKQVHRRTYGSGLTNLGNTCFMNSTLQCLAHTHPLQRYFLSGAYKKDLNRGNPLGTGGELATEFASLLSDMWLTSSLTYGGSLYSTYDSASHVVYPRSFKYALGKHAEQFMGYDQHDSQEFATYLLDALHEDTNRVTQKPYVEKPEQGDNESDEEAADKAWDLHKKREDSEVLEYFMGQVKSRVQCCEEGCGRISTTFDPFMYLSVPIPGSSQRTLRVTYVPLEPSRRALSLTISLNKTSTINELLKKASEEVQQLGVRGSDDPVALEDLCAVDVWQNEFHSWYQGTDEIDKIGDHDETFIYELRPLVEIQSKQEISHQEDDVESKLFGKKVPHPGRYQLDLPTLTRLNRNDEWSNILRQYLKNTPQFLNAFHPKKGSTEDRIRIYQRLTAFIELCHKEAEAESAGQKRVRDEVSACPISPSEEPVAKIEHLSDMSNAFKDVKTRYDLAVLEFSAAKMRAEILKMEREGSETYPNGILLEVQMHNITAYHQKDQVLTAPLALRIPSTMSVYDLREEIARRLSRSLKSGNSPISSPGESSAERDPAIIAGESSDVDVPVDSSLGAPTNGQASSSPEMLIIRQIPMRAERRRSTLHRPYSTSAKVMGMLERIALPGSQPISLAVSHDETEKMRVSEMVSSIGVVHMDWPPELLKNCFDITEYETIEDPKQANAAHLVRRMNESKNTTVLDCIEKYCQMEQLEDTEMWYCNRCKKHVRAWKQFHLYRSPPLLIVHLKRFQYSARTHRRDKIGVFIDFPLEGLDLRDHVMRWTEGEKPIYDCYAVSNHYGGLGGGHYTAHALNDNGVWCYYDDSRITTNVDPKEVVSEAAYVLYYRRRDVTTDHNYELHLHTNEAYSSTTIQDTFDKPREPSDVSSNAALAGDEDDMDIDGMSRSASPTGSIAANSDVEAESDYLEMDEINKKDDTFLSQ